MKAVFTLIFVMSLSIGIQLLRQRLHESVPYKRKPVPQDKVNWSTEWKEYDPPEYTALKVLEKPPWADAVLTPGQTSGVPKWNSIDGLVNRISYLGSYQIDKDGYPLNPAGRTGVKGRGNLGRYGPNHAADPIITRWTRSKKVKVLQFVGIQRKDTGEWAIPGGMVDPGEDVYATCKREFLEEVFDSDAANQEEKNALSLAVQTLFSNPIDIYKGYVDDPRNTDNAWMETHAVNFHVDEEEMNSVLSTFKAGSDAINAGWIDISPSLRLYASHRELVKHVAEIHGAWK